MSRPKYIYISMTDEQIDSFSPKHYKSLEAAVKDMRRICVETAKANGYSKNDIFVPGVLQIEKRIEELWES